ncbi:MAG: SDR family oxidoreductase [Candidatus Dormibacteraeota bacterium]|nr:SDR family oxidoreductase [Candidatus Dormibacteraeota bacterium]
MQDQPKVALVTGCGKRDGMGQAIARTLAATGAVVCVSDRIPTGVLNLRQEVVGVGEHASWGGVDSLVEEIGQSGGEAFSTLGDIGSEDDASRMVDQVVERCGRLDILVNTAAAPQGRDRADVEEVPVEVWDEVIRINLRGTFLMSRFAVPHMRRQHWGRIVNISSLAGLTGAPFSTAYSASKAGIIGLTRALSADVAPWGITVNAICPGMVATSRAVISQDPNLDVKEEIERRGRNIAVGRPGMPEDIAATVAYFASDAASYVTGQALVLDGGGFSAFPRRRPPESNGGSSQ